MKSSKRKQRVEFLLSINELAHGLGIIQALEPSYTPVSLNAMVRLVYRDYLAKMSLVSNPVATQAALEQIKRMIGASSRQQAASVNDDQELIDIQRQQQSSSSNNQLTIAHQEVCQLNKELVTDSMTAKLALLMNQQEELKPEVTTSQVSVVTDFSPPSLEELIESGGE